MSSATYGLRTLLNGVLWPGPHIGRRNEAILRAARDRGHEVGIHCYDHIRWQDGLARMSRAEVYAEFDKARREFERIYRRARANRRRRRLAGERLESGGLR